MNADALLKAREQLGKLWGLKGPVSPTEFGRLMGFGPQRPDMPVRRYETGEIPVPRYVELLIDAMLSGWRPSSLEDRLAGRGEFMPPPMPKAPPRPASVASRVKVQVGVSEVPAGSRLKVVKRKAP